MHEFAVISFQTDEWLAVIGEVSLSDGPDFERFPNICSCSVGNHMAIMLSAQIFTMSSFKTDFVITDVIGLKHLPVFRHISIGNCIFRLSTQKLFVPRLEKHPFKARLGGTMRNVFRPKVFKTDFHSRSDLNFPTSGCALAEYCF